MGASPRDVSRWFKLQSHRFFDVPTVFMGARLRPRSTSTRRRVRRDAEGGDATFAAFGLNERETSSRRDRRTRRKLRELTREGFSSALLAQALEWWRA